MAHGIAVLKRPLATILSAALIPVAFALGLWLRCTRPWESPVERAYRVCRECADLPQEEVDRLIETIRVSPGSREDKLDVFLRLFVDPADADVCEPRAEAVLDAAAEEEP